jgi:hypothetical protein
MHEVLALLALRNARMAQQGKPCPVAARVVWRLEMLSEMRELAAR